jgi:hypothetical protein
MAEVMYHAALINVSQEFHGGEVEYVALCARSQLDGDIMRQQMFEELSPLSDPKTGIPKSVEAMRQTSLRAKVVHQEWIDAGRLVPGPLALWRIPGARVYPDGRVVAVDRFSDDDMRALEAACEQGQQQLAAKGLPRTEVIREKYRTG